MGPKKKLLLSVMVTLVPSVCAFAGTRWGQARRGHELNCWIEFAQRSENREVTPVGVDRSFNFRVNLTKALGRTFYGESLEIESGDIDNIQFDGRLRAFIGSVGFPVGNVGGPFPLGPLNRRHYFLSLTHSSDGSIISYATGYFKAGMYSRIEGYSGRAGIADYALACEPMRRRRR